MMNRHLFISPQLELIIELLITKPKKRAIPKISNITHRKLQRDSYIYLSLKLSAKTRYVNLNTAEL